MNLRDPQGRGSFTLFFIAALATASGAMAHGGQEHVMGTVKALDDKSIVLTTKGGKEVAIKLDAGTKYDNGTTAAKAADVKVGDRVVVHAKKALDVLTAVLIKVGKGAASGERGGTHGHSHEHPKSSH